MIFEGFFTKLLASKGYTLLSNPWTLPAAGGSVTAVAGSSVSTLPWYFLFIIGAGVVLLIKFFVKNWRRKK